MKIGRAVDQRSIKIEHDAGSLGSGHGFPFLPVWARVHGAKKDYNFITDLLNGADSVRNTSNQSEIIAMLLPKKTVKQVAVLPIILADGGVEVMLLTSRRRGRWVLPKGWSRSGEAMSVTASAEAFEESGIAGLIASHPVGHYTYEKRMRGGYSVISDVSVYPMLVDHHLIDWPERGERDLRWFPIGKAAEKIDDEEAAAMLRGLSDTTAEEIARWFTDDVTEAPDPMQPRSFARTLAETLGI